ncbi:hypothetical protein GCM10028793_07400 [Nocardiopsis oceani]
MRPCAGPHPSVPCGDRLAGLDDGREETGDDHHRHADDHEHERDGSDHGVSFTVSFPGHRGPFPRRPARRDTRVSGRGMYLFGASPYLAVAAVRRWVPALTSVVQLSFQKRR